MRTYLTWFGVLEDKVLILKLASIYGFPPSAVVIGEISTLAHKLRDDSVETAALESKALLMVAQTTEIFCRAKTKQKSFSQQSTKNLIGKLPM